MAVGNEHGWDFVKVGHTYQYKEDRWIAEVTILADNSTDEEYRFDVLVDKATEDYETPEFKISWMKNFTGYFSGMINLYENPEYRCTYKYVR